MMTVLDTCGDCLGRRRFLKYFGSLTATHQQFSPTPFPSRRSDHSKAFPTSIVRFSPTSTKFCPQVRGFPARDNHFFWRNHKLQSKPENAHPPSTNNDGFQLVMSKRNQHRLNATIPKRSIATEAKIFTLREKTT